MSRIAVLAPSTTIQEKYTEVLTPRANDLSSILLMDAPLHTDISYTQALKEIYRNIMISHGAYELGGVIDIRHYPKRIKKSVREYWNTSVIGNGDSFYAPTIVCRRYQSIKDAGVPQLCLLLAEQFLNPITIEEIDEDPLLIFVVKMGENIGKPYLIGAWKHT